MYAMSTLSTITLSIFFALAMASAHAIMRPVVNEYYFVNQPQPRKVPTVVHSDGFVDDEQEEVAFGKENDDPNSSSTVRRRSLEGKGKDS
jgi:hypothetical protein